MLNRKNDDYDYNGDYRMSSLNEILIAERRLANKKLALEDMRNEYNLIEEQTFMTYKKNVEYLLIGQKGIIDKATKWLTMLKNNQDNDGNKIDGRKKYEEKEMYDYYVGMIKDLLGINEIADVKFINYNFGQSTEIEFLYLGHKWRLGVPHIVNIKLKDYKQYGSSIFKLSLSHNDVKYSSCWTVFGYTYEEDELKDLLADGIRKYCGDEIWKK